jgi:hypothetical protein
MPIHPKNGKKIHNRTIINDYQFLGKKGKKIKNVITLWRVGSDIQK